MLEKEKMKMDKSQLLEVEHVRAQTEKTIRKILPDVNSSDIRLHLCLFSVEGETLSFYNVAVALGWERGSSGGTRWVSSNEESSHTTIFA
jgi:hypothetical protein